MVAAMNGRLLVDFCGEERALQPPEELTFGRCGGLSIDDNPYLHRVVGRFVHRSGTWWLDHLGRRAPLTVRDANGPTLTTVAPGSTLALGHVEFSLSFAAGPTRYEILGALEDREWEVALFGPEGLDGTRTLDWGRVELNADQRLLLVAMCEARLVDPRSTEVPLITNRQGAARLGWTLTKFNRKLDHLCEKLHRAGVAGVHGAAGDNALDRRVYLVQHALAAPLVGVEDLALLDKPVSAA